MSSNKKKIYDYDGLNTFKYMSDWFIYFSKILSNKNEKAFKKYKIKSMIIESHKDIKELFQIIQPDMERKNKEKETIELIESKEKEFYNIRIKNKHGIYYFYADTENPRFWIIHYIDIDGQAQKLANKLSNMNFNDSIYLTSNEMIQFLQLNNNDITLFKKYDGYSELKELNILFEQKFVSYENNAIINTGNNDFIMTKFNLTISNILDKNINNIPEILKKNGIPLSYKSLKYLLFRKTSDIKHYNEYDEDITDLINKQMGYTEEELNENISETVISLSYNGEFEIIDTLYGDGYQNYINFVRDIRDYYANSITDLEKNRIDWKECKGDLYRIIWDEKLIIDPKIFGYWINKLDKIFKINAFYMDKQDRYEQYIVYDCIDTHNGDSFFMQVFKNKIYINIGKKSCVNVVKRLLVLLKLYFSPDCVLMLSNDNKIYLK